MAVAIQQNIIWNFMDATSINVNTAVYGSILAPKATISGNSPINGSVVAKVFQSNGEVHLGTFNGNTGFLSRRPPSGGGGHVSHAGACPSRASWMTMLLGFGFIGSLIRQPASQGASGRGLIQTSETPSFQKAAFGRLSFCLQN